MRPTCGSTRHLTEGQLCSTLPSHRYPNPSVRSGYPPLTPPSHPTPPLLLLRWQVVCFHSSDRQTDRCLYVCVSAQTGVCASCFLGRGWGGGSWAPVTMPHHPPLLCPPPFPRPLCATVTGLARGSGGGGRLSTTDPPRNNSSDQRLTAAGVTQPDPEVNQLITHPRVLRPPLSPLGRRGFFFRGRAKRSPRGRCRIST